MTSSAPALVLSPARHYAHTSANGFCTVCGTVWPCSAASRASVKATVMAPTAR